MGDHSQEAQGNSTDDFEGLDAWHDDDGFGALRPRGHSNNKFEEKLPGLNIYISELKIHKYRAYD